MDKSGRLEMLVRVVDKGSLVGAARSLGVTSSAVSRGLADLESLFGVRLLNRSTRKIQLTDDGVQVYERAIDVLARIQDLETAVARKAQKVSGVLRVGLPVPLGRYIIWPRIGVFLSRYPEMQIHCKPVQDPKAMQAENFDIMLMAGEPPPSRLIARRLALGRPGIFASPEYIRRFGEPVEPSDLQSHRCLVFHGDWMQTPATDWNFMRGTRAVNVRVTPRVVTPDREGLIVAALSGAGVIRMACFDPSFIETGRLRRLLPGWECTDGFNVYAIYRRGTSVAPRIKAFLEFVQESFESFDPDQVTLIHNRGANQDFRVQGE